MNSIIRSVRGNIVSVTTRDEAVRQSIQRLNPRPEDLIAEIEHRIQQERGEHLIISCRAGDYTPEVVLQVADLYRANGWRVDTSHPYWMKLES